MTSQSPGTKHYIPIHIPAWRTSIKQNIYSALLECYYNLVLDQY